MKLRTVAVIGTLFVAGCGGASKAEQAYDDCASSYTAKEQRAAVKTQDGRLLLCAMLELEVEGR